MRGAIRGLTVEPSDEPEAGSDDELDEVESLAMAVCKAHRRGHRKAAIAAGADLLAVLHALAG